VKFSAWRDESKNPASKQSENLPGCFSGKIHDERGEFGSASSREKKRCELCRKHQKGTAGGAFSPPAALSSILLINKSG
jgi:hypothetical protein